jgi:hypothetical protein
VQQTSANDTQQLEELLEHFVSVNEAATELGINPPALRSRIQQQTILSVKAPTGVLIPKEEIARLKEKIAAKRRAADGKRLADA